jgi:hypothetical protein
MLMICNLFFPSSPRGEKARQGNIFDFCWDTTVDLYNDDLFQYMQFNHVVQHPNP